MKMTGKITFFAASAVALSLVSGCGQAKDPMLAVRDEFQECARINDFVCVARLTPKSEREAMGFRDEEAAAKFLEDYFWKVNARTTASSPTAENTNSGYGISFPYRTASIPDGEMSVFIEQTPTGPVVQDLYYQLMLIDGASQAIAKGEEMLGTNKLRQFANFFRAEGNSITKEYGITGIYESNREGKRTFRTWIDLADYMDSRAAAAEARSKAREQAATQS
jgi:hypothetical protein